MRILNAVYAVRVSFQFANLFRRRLSHAVDSYYAVRVSRRQEDAFLGKCRKSVDFESINETIRKKNGGGRIRRDSVMTPVFENYPASIAKSSSRKNSNIAIGEKA